MEAGCPKQYVFIHVRDDIEIPVSVEHESTEDDEYDGYFIPKGTIVIGNSWYALFRSKNY